MIYLEDKTDQGVAAVRSWIDEAERVVVLTGAGISTDSGIPDVRGPEGLWTKNPDAEKTATLQNYLSNPEARKRSWSNRVGTFGRGAKPNAGHVALVDLEARGKLDVLITQNVDGLHQEAGIAQGRMVEIHGTTREFVCMSCGERGPIERVFERVQAGEEDPPCRSCGGVLKSATISFGQSLVPEDLLRSEQSAQSCDLLLAIGSTLSVYPIAAVVPIAKQSGARIAILNAQPTDMDHIADAVLRGSISEILPRLTAP